MEEWKEYNLGDLVELKNGVAFKSSEFIESGIPVIKIKNVKPNKILLDDLSYVSEQSSKNRKCFDILPSDILITMTGNRKDGGPDSWVGKVALFGKFGRYLLNQRVSAIRVKRKDLVEYQYLAYLLSCWDAQLYFVNHSNSSGGQANISPDVVYGYNITLPTLSEQTRIAAILSSIDDKIEVNRRINENVEQQAQALFKSWLVDFKPFKDGEFVESELGMIPKGWQVTTLTSIANYLNGLAMQKFRPVGEDKGIPVLKIKELGQGTCDSSSDRCSSQIDEQYKVNDGDIIFSWSGTLLVDSWCGGVCGLNQHLFKVTSKEFPKWFYYMWTKEHLNNFIHIAKDKAVTMGHIKRGHLEEAKVLVPPQDVFGDMTKTMQPIIEEIIGKKIENRKLAQLRDTLLPRLMSGELNVNEITA